MTSGCDVGWITLAKGRGLVELRMRQLMPQMLQLFNSDPTAAAAEDVPVMPGFARFSCCCCFCHF
jgi:hypothetical protein